MARWKFPLLVSLLFSLLYIHYFSNRAFVELDIKVTKISWFKIYWAAPGKPFSEENMVRIRVHPEEEHYRFFATDLRKVARLRIDPHQYAGMAVIKKLVITQAGYSPLEFATKDDFARLRPLDQIIGAGMLADGFTIFSSGEDPNFELIPVITGSPPYQRDAAMIGAIVAAVFLFFFLTGPLRDESQFVPLFFAMALALVLAMSGVSAPDAHPDEYVHMAASQYYMANWLPARIDDPAIRNTYSIYGFSRLNKREVYYIFSGKMAQLLTPFKLPDYLAHRMLNLVLFAGILLMVLRSGKALLLATPLLISPQLWYMFSGCNSDAFALFVSFIASVQVAGPDSFFNRFLVRERGWVWFGQLLLLGLLLAVLIGLKKNYWFFILFLGGYAGWKIYFQAEARDRAQFFRRAVLVVLVGLALTGMRLGADYWVNGLDREEKVARMRVDTAIPLFNPNTPLEKMHCFLYRKARGDSLRTLVVKENWFGKTCRTAFGIYGYFTIAGSDSYYNLILLVGAAFLCYLSAGMLLRAPPAEKLVLLLFYGGALTLIGVSLWHSWTSDFQTQGRYLFSIVPMFSLLVWHAKRYVADAGFRLFLVAMFVLSLYSYVYIALQYIART